MLMNFEIDNYVDKGIAINPAVYTVDELSKELVALKRGGGKKC